MKFYTDVEFQMGKGQGCPLTYFNEVEVDQSQVLYAKGGDKTQTVQQCQPKYYMDQSLHQEQSRQWELLLAEEHLQGQLDP